MARTITPTVNTPERRAAVHLANIENDMARIRAAVEKMDAKASKNWGDVGTLAEISARLEMLRQFAEGSAE